MKNARNWTVRGYDTSNYTKSVGVQLASVPGAVTKVVRREREAVQELLIGDTIKTMSVGAVDASQTTQHTLGFYVSVNIPVYDYSSIRSERNAIIGAVNQWAEKMRINGLRGFRANAIKKPIIEKNSKGTYSLKFNVIFSNVIFYTSNTRTVGITNDQIAKDFESLATMVTYAAGMPVTVSHKEA